ncbi:protein kinase domain-containing protein, partial [Kribbella albertanoniae]
MEPEDLAGYSLRRRLGSGSAGTLWQVRDLATGRHAVLRRIPVPTIQREEQFRDELMVLRRINHPHITRVLEVRETATEWLVFSQYVVALSLTEILRRRGTMSPGEIVTLLSPLADALHYLHHCGLIHGHLTPPNILIDVEGRPLLTDATFHSLNLHPPTSPPPSHGADLLALSTVAAHAGGPATLFDPAVFTKTPAPRLASHLLTLTTPEPINLGDPDDAPPDPPTTTT